MFLAGPDQSIPLCLDCNAKLEAMNARRFDDIGRAMNYMNAEMESMAGLPNSGPRYEPRRSVTIVGNQVLNHIRISDSQIGVLNTGTIGSIDNAIGVLQRDGDSAVARSLKELTEQIAAATEVNPGARRQATDLVGAIASEAATPVSDRRPAVARALIVDLSQVISGIAGGMQLWAAYAPAIKAFFNIH